MPKIDSVENVYDELISNGFYEEAQVDKAEISKVLMMKKEDYMFAKRWKQDKNANWRLIFNAYYDILRELCDQLIHFKNQKTSNHQAVFAFIILHFPELELDWELLERIRLMRNDNKYRGVDIKQHVVAYNRSPNPITEAANHGAIPAHSLQELIDKLPSPKIVWIMIKSGQPVDDMIAQLVPLLQKEDIIIDGGNSYFEDSKRRYAELKKKGIHFLDCGTSGAMEGARHGACMMIGGEKEIFQKVGVLFKDMCVKEGYGYMGSAGAGHFVKMVHNGIEYGMMQAIAEGMQAVKNASFGTDVKTAINVYAHGDRK